jgi:EmrB/QacA subfamily drug resistance transporter
MNEKWIALSNTSISVFLAFANYNMILIALPAIFEGIHFNPNSPYALTFLIWLILGYMIVTSATVLTFGRIADIIGRVRLYNIGFLIFTIGSFLLSIVPDNGVKGVAELIAFRMVQGVGGGLLMVNGAAILADYFPRNELGKALGINQVSGLVGGLVGLIIGGLLSIIDWRLIFAINVPIGIFGFVWSLISLKERGIKSNGRLDVIGSIIFISSLTILLVSLSYGIIPYDGDQLGWGNPYVIFGIIISFVLLGIFVYIERKIKEPLFDFSLFKIRTFTSAIFSNMIASLARQGITLILILLLQAIWLPLHGYSFADTPFWAGIYLLPNILGFAVFGPLSGYLSDKFGSKPFTILGLLLSSLGFFLLTLLPYNFDYIGFAIALFIIGAGFGIFTSPNSADIMASVPPEKRGIASGMRSALQNAASTSSIALYFSIVITGMSNALPSAISQALSSEGINININIPASQALFSALLGYNPLTLILGNLPPNLEEKISDPKFFSNAIAPAFMQGFRVMLYISITLLIIASIVSLIRSGEKRARMGASSQRL